jgi:hypothetical protein
MRLSVSEPKTVAELLDAAQDGEQFGAVVMDIFAALEKLKWKEQDDDE